MSFRRDFACACGKEFATERGRSVHRARCWREQQERAKRLRCELARDAVADAAAEVVSLLGSSIKPGYPLSSSEADALNDLYWANDELQKALLALHGDGGEK